MTVDQKLDLILESMQFLLKVAIDHNIYGLSGFTSMEDVDNAGELVKRIERAMLLGTI